MNKHIYTFLMLSVLVVGAATGCTKKNENTTPEKTSQQDTSGETKNASDKIISEDDILLEEDLEDEIEVVSEDVYGEDIEFVERYPESVRSYYEEYDGEKTVTYQTKDSQEDVRNFFNERLDGKDGWVLSAKSTDYMEYTREKDGGEEYLSLYLYEYPDQGVTEFELVYEPPYEEDEELSEEDVEVLEEE